MLSPQDSSLENKGGLMNAYRRVACSEQNFLETSKSTVYIMSVELLAVKSGAQERGKGIKGGRMEGGLEL